MVAARLTLDPTGNMTSVPKPASLANGFTLKYDAWNRLVEVQDVGNLAARYDGLNRRTVTVRYITGYPSNYDHRYYNASWQVVETRVYGSSGQPETAPPWHQYVWSARYIDSPVLRDWNSDSDNYCDDHRLYYLGDANFNVTTLVDTGGDAVERYLYAPYGKVTIYTGDWSSTRSSSSYHNVYLYTGRERSGETGFYNYRKRYYHAQLGRFISRDPIGADINLHRYVRNRPLMATDPSGLAGYVLDIPASKWKCMFVTTALVVGGSDRDRFLFGSWLSGTRPSLRCGFDWFDVGGEKRASVMEQVRSIALAYGKGLPCLGAHAGRFVAGAPQPSNAFSATRMISNYRFWYECAYIVSKKCDAQGCCTSIHIHAHCFFHAQDTVNFWPTPSQTFGLEGFRITDRLVRACFPTGRGFTLAADTLGNWVGDLPCK